MPSVSGIGFALALIIMASIRERLELADVPKSFQGLPIAFIVTGLIALAFLGSQDSLRFEKMVSRGAVINENKDV